MSSAGGNDATTGTLIIGASQAGVQIATSLRELGDEEPILLVGKESHPPYQRPPLSKAFLTGKIAPEGLQFRSPDWYVANRIDLACGEKITSVTLPQAEESGVAVTAAGRRIAFQRLALTVGGRARRLSIPGHDLAGVSYLRHLDDAGDLRKRLDDARDVVVIGGGFIGLEAAASARAAGKNVTVVDVADRLLGRAVAPEVSEFYLAAHERRGTRVLLGASVIAVRGVDGTVTGVELSDGRVLPADLVLVGVGLVPRTELAEQLGLEVDGGIVVDSRARTSHRAVVAAGDCTTLPHPLTGTGRLRIESVQNAIAQARVAAATLLGRTDETRAVPWFWSDQDTLKLQIAGLSAGHDEVVLRGDPDTESFSALYFSNGKLIAADSVNAPRDHMVVRKVLGADATVDKRRAADSGTPLKELIQRLPSGLSG